MMTQQTNVEVPDGYHAVFVYGTLKRDSQDDKFSIKGRLFDLGRFPGLILGGDKKIPGQVTLVNDYELQVLDKYEGAPNLYTRERSVAQSTEQPDKSVEVWVYQWNLSTDGYQEIDKWN